MEVTIEDIYGRLAELDSQVWGLNLMVWMEFGFTLISGAAAAGAALIAKEAVAAGGKIVAKVGVDEGSVEIMSKGVKDAVKIDEKMTTKLPFETSGSMTAKEVVGGVETKSVVSASKVETPALETEKLEAETGNSSLKTGPSGTAIAKGDTKVTATETEATVEKGTSKVSANTSGIDLEKGTTKVHADSEKVQIQVGENVKTEFNKTTGKATFTAGDTTMTAAPGEFQVTSKNFAIGTNKWRLGAEDSHA
jgi:hypothetical protein